MGFDVDHIHRLCGDGLWTSVRRDRSQETGGSQSKAVSGGGAGLASSMRAADVMLLR